MTILEKENQNGMILKFYFLSIIIEFFFHIELPIHVEAKVKIKL